MADKEKKDKKEMKVANPTEGQTSVQESAEEVAPVDTKKKKKAEAVPRAPTKAAKPDGAAKNGASIAGDGLKRVPGNSKTPEEIKPAIKSVPAPSRDEIAHLAHHFWRERGGDHGAHEQDWYRAEQELRGKAS